MSASVLQARVLLSASVRPYSLSLFFCLMARWRSCTLCSFEPVK